MYVLSVYHTVFEHMHESFWSQPETFFLTSSASLYQKYAEYICRKRIYSSITGSASIYSHATEYAQIH